MKNTYDVVIIGGGASGTSLLYALARYTTVKNIALVEKYDKPGQVNTKACNNSQTLHVGDIETNYGIDKVRHVLPASMMIVNYANALDSNEYPHMVTPVHKMVLGVGDEEIYLLEKRYHELLPLFPDLQLLRDHLVGEIEPAVWEGRKQGERIAALYNPKGYAVNFEKLSQSFVNEAQKYNPTADIRYSSMVTHIEKIKTGYRITLENGDVLESNAVVVDADSYSLFFAKQLGYGKNYSLIPIGGTFYFSDNLLNGKVYTVQKPELPFAAVHGDPDIEVAHKTRFGPTARFYPVLESRKLSTFWDYLHSSGLGNLSTWLSFIVILCAPIRFYYLLENMLYELPWIGKLLFARTARKIVPTLRAKDLTLAKGYGGMRLQRVDITTHELQLGEGKIVGDENNKIIFNMTPSPGASVALYNAYRDAEQIVSFLGSGFMFDKKSMEHDLIGIEAAVSAKDISTHDGYPA